MELTSDPRLVNSYTARLSINLKACHQICKLLIDEHRTQHRERIIALRPDPCVYGIGSFVFVRRVVKSDSKKNRVGKLEFAYTGPWEVIERLEGGSYKCRHSQSGKEDKFHASRLSPCPPEITPFAPVDGPDTRFGQINRGLSEDAYKAASIDGFNPPQPWAEFHPKDRVTFPSDPTATANIVKVPPDQTAEELHFPTLAELNDEMGCWTEEELLAFMQDLQPLQSSHNFSLCPAPTDTPSPLPPIAQLSTSIVQSSDRLFFVAWRQPCSDRREWHLVSINLESSMALNPRCLHDGRFLADFYIRHPHDSHQHPTNQRWWLEYHPASTPARLHHGDYHIIRPDKNAST